MGTILIKRGTGEVPSLLEGELAYCFDKKELYVGDPDGNQLVGKDFGAQLEERLGEFETVLGDIEAALDAIIDLQDELVGGV